MHVTGMERFWASTDTKACCACVCGGHGGCGESARAQANRTNARASDGTCDATQTHHAIEVVHQEGAVIALLRDALGATKIDVHRIAVRLDVAGGLEEDLRVVRAELRDEGPVGRTRREVLASVLGALNEEARVQHGRVSALGPVPAAEHAEW